MFSGVSRTNSRINPDGSFNVRCVDCGRFIAKSLMWITKAQCELCRRALNGEKITTGAIREYELAKMGNADPSIVTGVMIPDPPPGFSSKFTLRSMGSDIVQAMGFKKAEKPSESATVAKRRHRGRLFEGLDIEETPQVAKDLGNIKDIDSKLRKAAEEE